MKHTFLTTILFIAMILPVAGCSGLESAGHKYLMRGQILEAKDGSVYLCIGSTDGAHAGQELSVYKFERVPGPHKNITNFKRDKTGTVKITQVVNEHFATAQIIDGVAKESSMVELNP